MAKRKDFGRFLVAISKTFSGILNGLFQMLSQAFQPILLQDYSHENIKKLLADLRISSAFSGLISNLLFAVFFALGFDFLRLWIPTQNITLIWRLTIITLAGSIVEGAVYPLYFVYTLTIKKIVPCIITIVGGVINIIGMYFLIEYTTLGIYSIALTTTIVMTLINFISNPIYAAICLRVHKLTFYPMLLKHCFSCIMLTVFFLIIKSHIEVKGWISLVIIGFFLCCVGAIAHLCVMIGITKIVAVIKKGD